MKTTYHKMLAVTLVLTSLCDAQAVYNYFPPPGMTYTAANALMGATNSNTGGTSPAPGQCIGGASSGLFTCATAVPNYGALPFTGANNGTDLLLGAGYNTAISASSLKGNNFNTTLGLGYNGDMLTWFANDNPLWWAIAGSTGSLRVGFGFKFGNASSPTSTTQGINWIGFGESQSGASACPGSLFGAQFPVALVPAAPCSWLMGDGYPLVIGMNTGPSPQHTVPNLFFAPNGNEVFGAVGGTTATKFFDATSTGTNQVTYALGDTHSGSITYLRSQTPAVSSGFSTGAVDTGCLPSSCLVTVGATGTDSTGTVTLPTATTGWSCTAADVTTPAGNLTQLTAQTVSSATFTNYSRTTGVATAWPNSDQVAISCFPH